MTEIGDSEQPGSIWPHVDEAIVDLVLDHRSSIVFANSRRLAERLTARLNEAYAARVGDPVETAHRPPAQIGAATEVTHGAEQLLARAHHGSVSKEQRAIIEDDLKRGRLRCVVATSSLELGIDMGAVDLVVQVEAPPSVASGLQRVGRAGHQVGEISKGVLFPKHRTDVVHCAVTAQRMVEGRIEAIRIPAHPLDILAQQTVAACALEPIDVDTWFDTVRGTGSYAALPRSAYESVLDLLAGRYPSDEFAELRPRLVWDRDAGTLTGRPGAQRLAVTSGGAIPDRGMFAVYMVGEKNSRVGELDEEMVYESRVGDVFALGATSWRIEEITFDRVLVTPAFGQPGRLPFWHGDGLGRPAELGAALGEFVRKAGDAPTSGGRRDDRSVSGGSDRARGSGEVTDRDELGTGELVVKSSDELSGERKLSDRHEELGLRDPSAVHEPSRRKTPSGDRRPAASEPAAAGRRRTTAGRTRRADTSGRTEATADAMENEGAAVPARSDLVALRSAGVISEQLFAIAARAGLDLNATTNLNALLAEQRAATGYLPTDRTLVVERFRDELGDWRLVLHSPFGLPAHAPWALAVGARLRERFGVDVTPNASDDGIVVRLPDTTDDPPGADLFVFDPDEIDEIVTEQVGGSALFASRFRECAARALLLPRRDPGKRAPLWQQRQRSAQLLDVARKFPTFPILLETVRECLRDVYDLPSLRDLLGRVAHRKVRIMEVETATPSPFANALLFDYIGQFMYEGDSPLAERRAAALSLDSGLLAELLGRVELRELLDAAVLDETERELQRLTPERRARDAEGLADLLRLLGPLTPDEAALRCVRPDETDAAGEVASGAEVGAGAATGRHTGAQDADSARTWSDSRATTASDMRIEATVVDRRDSSNRHSSPTAHAVPSDIARTDEISATDGGVPGGNHREWFAELRAAKRALEVTFAGRTWWAAIEDASRLRDALGVPLPIGTPAAFIEPVPDPLGDLVARYARTHAPFVTEAVAARFGLGAAVAATALQRLAAEKRVVEGEFTPAVSGSEWCDAQVLRRLRRRSLAAARHEVEPVATAAFGRFLPSWQHVGTGTLRGVDGVATVVEQLAGVPVPASALESLILPARVADYSPALLDELMASGEVLWSGHGAITAKDGWIALHPADQAPFTLAPPDDIEFTETHLRLLQAFGIAPQARPVTPSVELETANESGSPSGSLSAAAILGAAAYGGAYFFRQLSDATGLLDDIAVSTALWDLVWAGLVSGDTFAPVRGLLSGTARTTTAHRSPRRTPRGRTYLPRPNMPSRTGPPSVAGRWSLLPERVSDNTVRAHATADTLLERYGVLTRGSVQNEGVTGGFALMYRVLTEFEDRGRCRRGYFIDSLGGAQFSTTDVVDRLRGFDTDRTRPGRPPARVTPALAACDPANPYGAALPWPKGASEGGHRPGRKAGALVVLADGELALYLERGGKTLLTFTEDPDIRQAAATALGDLVRDRRVDSLVIDRIDGDSVHGHTFAEFLTAAGFSTTPRGLRLRGRP
uniref:Lhr family ATP-dependent helicase n=1 Tax=Nocardia bovistercoris TaxID=2785916 RepID=UPI0038CDB3D2